MEDKHILVLNAGSSTLKYGLFNNQIKVHDGSIEVGTDGHAAALNTVLKHVGSVSLEATVHRVVHGGTFFKEPTYLTTDAIEKIESTIPLAPLHQGPALCVIKAVKDVLAQVPHIACFDTQFHRTLPDSESMFAIPRKYFEHGVRRYGFHGLSYQSIARQLTTVSQHAASGKTVVCHLGNGSSVCGMVAGVSQYTSMGMTPVDGLIMGTRTGRIDPSVVFYMLRQNESVLEIEHKFNKESGLLAISELSSDMRVLLASDNSRAQLAVEMYCSAVAKEILAASVLLDGLDAIVFTAGIGENSPVIRERICRKLKWLGVGCDPIANSSNASFCNTSSSTIQVLCIPTDEQSEMNQLATELLQRETEHV